MAKNYYIILGLTPDATQEDIKEAYRRRAKEFHPDRYGPDTRPFVELQEAYTVLSHPGRKKAYDSLLREVRAFGARSPESLSPRASRPEPLVPQESRTDLGEVSVVRSFQTFHPSFDEIFDRLWSNFTSLSHPKGETYRSLCLEIPLTPEQARRGGTARILVPARALCPTCDGHGGVGLYECWHCGGEGFITGEFPILVSFPPILSGRHQVRIPLDSFGIRNLYLLVDLRVSGQAY